MKNIRTIYVVRNNDTNRHAYYAEECAPAQATPLLYYVGKTIKVRQADGSMQVAYMYGEKSYSYSSVEVAQHRETQRAKREEEAKRKKMLATIMAQYEAMDTDTLAQVLATM